MDCRHSDFSYLFAHTYLKIVERRGIAGARTFVHFFSFCCVLYKGRMAVYLVFQNSCVPSIVTVCWYVVAVGVMHSSLEIGVSGSVFGI